MLNVNEARELVCLRYEGCQDVDLRHSDGTEEYVQVKFEQDARYTINKLGPILQNFAADFIEAQQADSLHFAVVTRSNSLDEATRRLREHSPTKEDIDNIASLLRSATSFGSMSLEELLALTSTLLSRIQWQFGVGEVLDGQNSFVAQAKANLASFGISGPQLEDAYSALTHLLVPGREIWIADVRRAVSTYIGDSAIGIFDGKAQIVSKSLLEGNFSSERIARFYAGAPLSWDVLALNADITRSQQAQFMELLTQLGENLRLVCLVGESGAGKSTLAWRAAAELSRSHQFLVIRLKDASDPEFWYKLDLFYEKVKQPFFVLVDDVFRYSDAVRAMCELDTRLPITIVATSRPDELATSQVRSEAHFVQLREPDFVEKALVLEKLGKKKGDLSGDQLKRYNAANQFLVLMMELTNGRDLDMVIRNRLERLKIRDESSYFAYEYICSAFKYGLCLPETILDRLDKRGRFYRIPDRQTVEDLVFYEEGQEGSLRAGHPLLARLAVRSFALQRNPIVVLAEILLAIDPKEFRERRFALFLLLANARAEPESLRQMLPTVESTLEKIRDVSAIRDLLLMGSVYKLAGDMYSAARCEQMALTRPLVFLSDCYAVVGLNSQAGQQRAALLAILGFVERHPNAYSLSELLMGLVKRYGNSEEAATVLERIGVWVKSHELPLATYGGYLRFVKQLGSREQIDAVIEESISKRPAKVDSHIAYLVFAEKFASDEQLARLISESERWLGLHPSEAKVRAHHVGMIGRIGSPEQQRATIDEERKLSEGRAQSKSVVEANLQLLERGGTPQQLAEARVQRKADLQLQLTTSEEISPPLLDSIFDYCSPQDVAVAYEKVAAWLRKRPNNTKHRLEYLKFTKDKGTDSQAADVIESTFDWLLDHPREEVIRRAHMTLVGARGTADQVSRCIELTYRFLNQVENTPGVRIALLSLVENHGTTRHVSEWLAETRQYLIDNNDDVELRKLFLRVVTSKGRREEISSAIDQTEVWLRQAPKEDVVRSVYIGAVARVGTTNQVNLAVVVTDAWLKENPHDRNVRAAFIRLVSRRCTADRIKSVLDDTGRWLKLHPMDNYVRAAYQSAVARHGRPGSASLAVEQGGVWLSAIPSDGNARAGYLALLARKGADSEVEAAILETGSWLQAHPRDDNVRRALLALVKRRAPPKLARKVIDEVSAWVVQNPDDTESAYWVIEMSSR